MTLPLIYTLNNVDKKTKNGIINTVKNHHKNDKKVAELIVLVKNTGGLKYASEIMKNYQKEALTILSEFPNSDAKNSLELLVDYVINRKK